MSTIPDSFGRYTKKVKKDKDDRVTNYLNREGAADAEKVIQNTTDKRNKRDQNWHKLYRNDYYEKNKIKRRAAGKGPNSLDKHISSKHTAYHPEEQLFIPEPLTSTSGSSIFPTNVNPTLPLTVNRRERANSLDSSSFLSNTVPALPPVVPRRSRGFRKPYTPLRERLPVMNLPVDMQQEIYSYLSGRQAGWGGHSPPVLLPRPFQANHAVDLYKNMNNPFIPTPISKVRTVSTKYPFMRPEIEYHDTSRPRQFGIVTRNSTKRVLGERRGYQLGWESGDRYEHREDMKERGSKK
mgnify:CR=1 FL=1